MVNEPNHNTRDKFSKQMKPILFILPAFILLMVFTFWPFFRTIFLSFFRVTRMGEIREFVGWKNYLEILTDRTFRIAIKNSFLFSIVATPVSVAIGLLLAIVAGEKRKLSPIYETMFALSMAVSTSVAAMIFQLMYNPNLGILNHWLNSSFNWLGDRDIALWALMIIWVWMNTGFNFIFCLSAVRGMSTEMLESADLDGATGFLRLRRIIIPSISPTLFFLISTSFTGNMMMNALVMILTQGGPRNSTQTMMYYMISEGVINGDLNTGYAASVLIFLIVSVLLAGIFRVLEKKVFYR